MSSTYDRIFKLKKKVAIASVELDRLMYDLHQAGMINDQTIIEKRGKIDKIQKKINDDNTQAIRIIRSIDHKFNDDERIHELVKKSKKRVKEMKRIMKEMRSLMEISQVY